MTRVLSREELTAALAARQMLIERQPVAPAEAVLRLTPLQGQHAPAPFIALAARLEGFSREALEAAIADRDVVKTTVMRMTLHLVAAADYPAFAQLTRQPRMRTWRKTYPHLDEAEVEAELRDWFGEGPRTNPEIRKRLEPQAQPIQGPWTAVMFARNLLPLVQLPPAGFWDDPRRALFVVDPRPLPDPADAATVVLTRYLEAFGPASRRDVAAWAGVAQSDFAAAWQRIETVSYRDENGIELLDLPGRPLPPADTPLPVRFLAHWDQTLLAYAERERVMPAELLPLRLTISGDPVVTVEGRVAAKWALDPDGRIEVTPLVDLTRAARAEIRAEAKRTERILRAGLGALLDR